jgi:gliding motility-associated-like protein
MNLINLYQQLPIILYLYFMNFSAQAQKIMDPCFTSIEKPGMYYGSDSLVNACYCINYYDGADLLEWDGDEWLGRWPLSEVDLPPPADGCNKRAMWIGYPPWTAGGEAFAMKLDGQMETGKSYTFTFTYASDGYGSDGHFAPSVYIYHGSYPSMYDSYPISRLPEAGNSWTTNSITIVGGIGIFNADWILLWADKSSGLVLSSCAVQDAVIETEVLTDTTLCTGDSVTLSAKAGAEYHYLWNTGERTRDITVLETGNYSVEVTNYSCASTDDVMVNFNDCEAKLDMPNIFTPNDDQYNPIFKPREYNYLIAGRMIIYNRWGDRIFTGDLFEGWNGMIGKEEASTGIYYYDIFFTDEAGKNHKKRGTVTLAE